MVVGEHYERLAAKTVPLFERSTGLAADVIRPPAGADPFREKLRAAARPGPLVLFDVDCLFLRQWRIEEPAALTMAFGVPWSLCPWCPDGSVRVYNTGVMLVPDGCQPLFQRALDIYDAGPPNYFDEGPLRLAIRELDWPVVELDPRFNRQRISPPEPGTVVWHLVKPGCDPEFKYRAVVNALAHAERAGLIDSTAHS